MDNITHRRQQIQWNIRQNPTVITINRTEKIKTEGHFAENKSLVGPFTVRIFKQKSQAPKIQSELAGTMQNDNSWGLLADYQADIRSGSMVLDEFDCPLGHYQVGGVTPQILKGVIMGYQADLIRLS